MVMADKYRTRSLCIIIVSYVLYMTIKCDLSYLHRRCILFSWQSTPQLPFSAQLQKYRIPVAESVTHRNSICATARRTLKCGGTLKGHLNKPAPDFSHQIEPGNPWSILQDRKSSLLEPLPNMGQFLSKPAAARMSSSPIKLFRSAIN